MGDQGEAKVALEELMIGDTYDFIEPLEDYLKSCLSAEQTELYDGLLSGKMYVEIAENLGVSLRTLERQVQELKWLFEYLITEEDPDLKKS